jgi:hypothetical protein
MQNQRMNASFLANVSFIIPYAKSIRTAFEHVESVLHPSVIRLDRILLHNERGDQYSFGIEKVDKVEWGKVEHTDFGNKFLATGIMELSIIYPLKKRDSIVEIIKTAYRLPQSRISNSAVQSIPTRTGRYFVSVLDHSLIWKFELPDLSYSSTSQAAAKHEEEN